MKESDETGEDTERGPVLHDDLRSDFGDDYIDVFTLGWMNYTLVTLYMCYFHFKGLIVME